MPRVDRDSIILLPKNILKLDIKEIIELGKYFNILFVKEAQSVIVSRNHKITRIALPPGTIIMPFNSEIIDKLKINKKDIIKLGRPEWITSCRISQDNKLINIIEKNYNKVNFVEGKIEPREPNDPLVLAVSGLQARIPVYNLENTMIAAATVQGKPLYGYKNNELFLVKGTGEGIELLEYLLPLYASCKEAMR